MFVSRNTMVTSNTRGESVFVKICWRSSRYTTEPPALETPSQETGLNRRSSSHTVQKVSVQRSASFPGLYGKATMGPVVCWPTFLLTTCLSFTLEFFFQPSSVWLSDLFSFFWSWHVDRMSLSYKDQVSKCDHERLCVTLCWSPNASRPPHQSVFPSSKLHFYSKYAPKLLSSHWHIYSINNKLLPFNTTCAHVLTCWRIIYKENYFVHD